MGREGGGENHGWTRMDTNGEGEERGEESRSPARSESGPYLGVSSSLYWEGRVPTVKELTWPG